MLELQILFLLATSPETIYQEVLPYKKYFVLYKEELDKMLSIYASSGHLDLVIIQERLGKEFAMSLIQNDSSYSHSWKIAWYLSALKNKYKIGKIKAAANRILQLDENDIDEEMFEKIQTYIADISLLEDEFSNNKLDDILMTTAEYIDNIKSSNLVGASFGKAFKELDNITGGLEQWKVLRLGWGSNVGKTWLMYQFLLSFLEQGKKCYFFSLENAPELTMKNLCGLKKGVNSMPQNIKFNNLSFDVEIDYFHSLKDKFNLFWPQVDSLDQIYNICLRDKPDYIFIDYIQLIDLAQYGKDDKDRLAYYAKSVQKFATKYKIGVIDLSQLSNSTVRGGHLWEGSEEFGGSSALKNAADIWIHLFIDKEKDEARQDSDDMADKFRNPLKLKISKNRLGPTRMVFDYTLDFTDWGKYLPF